MAAPIRLTPEQVATLRNLEGDIRGLEQEIARAERTGLDVAAYKKSLLDARTLRDALLKEYG